MADTETTVHAKPLSVRWGQLIKATNGQFVRSLWKSGLLILALKGLFVTYLLVKPGGHGPVTFVDNVIQGLLEGGGLILALPVFLQGIGRTGRSPTSFAERVAPASIGPRWVPLLLSLGILSYIIGQFLWTYNENILQIPAKDLFPTCADAGFLGSCPFWPL